MAQGGKPGLFNGGDKSRLVPDANGLRCAETVADLGLRQIGFDDHLWQGLGFALGVFMAIKLPFFGM